MVARKAPPRTADTFSHRYASLRGANLRGANLRGANLCGANLCGASLRGAGFRRADFGQAATSAAAFLAGRPFAIVGLLLAFALRLVQLGQESLWYDELVSVDLASASLVDLIAQTARDIHPPGYYLLLHYWRQVAGPVMELGYSFEFIFAFPSLFFGILVCVLTYRLARIAGSQKVASLALLLAALHPFQVEYSQEVRMYTLGASLCLVYVLLSYRLIHLNNDRQQRSRTPLAALAAVTAAGLYTFYYFGLLLVVAGIAILLWWFQNSAHRARALRAWFLAHLGALLLWIPWLPIFLRQALDPPVPPWREVWTGFSPILPALTTFVSTYATGHVPLPAWIPPAGLALAILMLFGLAYLVGDKCNRSNWTNQSPVYLLILFAFGPPLLLIGLSALVTPLFHARYVYPFHAPFIILFALSAATIYRRRRAVGLLFFCVPALLLALVALPRLWTDPALRPDDHRRAVQVVAERWRPGDMILVNAGWVHRAFNVYWPRRHVFDMNRQTPTLPPPLNSLQRLTPDRFTAGLNSGDSAATHPTASIPIFYTGSVDAQENLGWQAADADFYSISRADTLAALDGLRRHSRQLWHYRIYDTVSDPNAVIRDWLATHGELVWDSPIAGRDFLRLEQYRLELDSADAMQQSPSADTPGPPVLATVRFLDGLVLDIHEAPPRAPIGDYLYLSVDTYPAPPDDDAPPELAASLRLLDAGGRVVAQADTPLDLGSVQEFPRQATLALPIPLTRPPTAHRVALVVYARASLAPLIPESVSNATTRKPEDSSIDLGALDLIHPTTPPLIAARPLAQFDYLQLLDAEFPTTIRPENASLPLALTWLPSASPYRDNYDLLIELVPQDAIGDSMALQWRVPLGPPEFPSGLWVTDYPIRHRLALPLDQVLDSRVAGSSTGAQYELRMGLRRATDDAMIPTRGVLGLAHQTWYSLGEIEIISESVTGN